MKICIAKVRYSLDTWRMAILGFITDIRNNKPILQEHPEIAFDDLALRRTPDGSGYFIIGKNPEPIEIYEGPHDAVKLVVATSTIDVENALGEFAVDNNIQLLTIAFNARPQLNLPAGKFDIWKYGDTLRVYAEGITEFVS